MKSCLILVLVCAFTTAMVPMPRERRALNSEELAQMSSTISSTTVENRQICAPQTPCAWSTYKPKVKMVEFNITNSYCICGSDTVCQMSEDDVTTNVYIFRCRPPVETEDEEAAVES